MKKFVPVDPSSPIAGGTVAQIDWRRCVLCQKNTQEKLSDPSKNPRADKYQGLRALAIVLSTLSDNEALSSLPFVVSLSALNDGSGLFESLKNNGAKYHKSCKLICSESKTTKISKRANSASGDQQSPIKTRRQAVPFDKDTCLFCDGPAKWNESLHRVSTQCASDRISNYAKILQKKTLLAKLAGAHDAMALDAMYHSSCYTDFKNDIRCYEMNNSQESSPIDKRELQEYALAELVAHINNIKDSMTDGFPTFSMSSLAEVYGNILRSMGVDHTRHSTRLRERLLRACPYLKKNGKPGQECWITFREDLDESIRSSVRNYHLQAFQFVDVAKNVRSDIFDCESRSWEETMDTQDETTPISLKVLLKMILRGPGSVRSADDDEDNFDQAVNTLSQLICFHTTRQTVQEHSQPRHSRKQEKPVPVYLAMKVYGDTRSKSLVTMTHKLGLSISYNRLLTILNERAASTCTKFHQQGVVCPPTLGKEIFTVAAADNIDHDTSSFTAKSSFHGTAISMVQFPKDNNLPDVLHNEPAGCTKERNNDLPQQYAVVKPCLLNPKALNIQPSENCTVSPDNQAIWPDTREYNWLKCSEDEDRLPWAVYHSRLEVLSKGNLSQSAVLPLFSEQAHSMAMMFHVMEVITAATKHLNPEQTPVLAVDQPLYALCKTIQLLKPETFGENHLVLMMGGLHLEMAALRANGRWLERSGWIETLAEAGVTTPGRAESMLKASHVTRTRYAHQVTAKVLFELQHDAYDEYVINLADDQEPEEFKNWHAEKSRSVPQFKYWDLVLNLELITLQLVRATRTGDFQLYKDSLSRLVVWFFALDHTNYSRWLPIHIRDLVQLTEKHPNIAAEFEAGNFVARKTQRPFSAIAVDQNHEQINAKLKGNGGMIGLTENSESLRKWLLATPDLAAYVTTFEEAAFGVDTDNNDCVHHTDKNSFIKLFRRDTVALKSVFEKLGNPFEEESLELYNIDSKVVANGNATEIVQNIENIGTTQYQTFVRDRLQSNAMSISDTIPQNRLCLWKPNVGSSAGAKQAAKLKSLKNDCALFSRLFIACQSREGDMEKFFCFENQPCPPSLSVLGQIRSCAKSDIIKCLIDIDKDSVLSTGTPTVHAKLFDGAALVHLLQPGSAKTFQEYSTLIFLQFLKKQCTPDVRRVDVIWDVYRTSSLKMATREKRGHGQRLAVTPAAKIPTKSWGNFLRETSNKQQLFRLLAKSVQNLCVDGVEFYSTLESSVLTSPTADASRFKECNHEEADTRIFLHLADAVQQGHTKCMIRTSDSDVIVLAVANVVKIPDLQELWVSIGTGLNHKLIAAHSISKSLGAKKAQVLPFFHAFTGCDVVSSFSSKGKKSAFDTWNAYPDATEGFQAASCGDISGGLPLIEKYVVSLYDRTNHSKNVNECRRNLFTKKARQIENIPPTQDALVQHLKRAAYQGGFVWGQCLKASQNLPDPTDWGWTQSGTESGAFWDPVWTTQPAMQESLLILVKCGCKQGCHGRCKCKKVDLPCTELCECGSMCNNTQD